MNQITTTIHDFTLTLAGAEELTLVSVSMNASGRTSRQPEVAGRSGRT